MPREHLLIGINRGAASQARDAAAASQAEYGDIDIDDSPTTQAARSKGSRERVASLSSGGTSEDDDHNLGGHDADRPMQLDNSIQSTASRLDGPISPPPGSPSKTINPEAGGVQNRTTEEGPIAASSSSPAYRTGQDLAAAGSRQVADDLSASMLSILRSIERPTRGVRTKATVKGQ